MWVKAVVLFLWLFCVVNTVGRFFETILLGVQKIFWPDGMEFLLVWGLACLIDAESCLGRKHGFPAALLYVSRYGCVYGLMQKLLGRVAIFLHQYDWHFDWVIRCLIRMVIIKGLCPNRILGGFHYPAIHGLGEWGHGSLVLLLCHYFVSRLAVLTVHDEVLLPDLLSVAQLREPTLFRWLLFLGHFRLHLTHCWGQNFILLLADFEFMIGDLVVDLQATGQVLIWGGVQARKTLLRAMTVSCLELIGLDVRFMRHDAVWHRWWAKLRVVRDIAIFLIRVGSFVEKKLLGVR